MDPHQRQFITCSAESYILVWDLKRPPAEILPREPTIHQADEEEDDVFDDGEKEEEKKKKEGPKTTGWASLKEKTSIIAASSLFSKDKKWSPAIGKYDIFL